MSFRPLKDLTILDISHRLPGPLCAKILGDLGARVIKIEDHKFQDPFLSGLFSQIDDSFLSWYKELNQNKEILRFDFDDLSDQSKITELVQTSHAVILGVPHKTREKLGLTKKDLSFNRPFVCIELLASAHEKKSLHDLNALAISGLLSLYVADKKKSIVEPPFLPIAGINFGHKAATDLLAGYICALSKNKSQFIQTYMDDATNNILGLFWSPEDRKMGRTKFLHNGLYPCYCLYRTKDEHFVALAAVEEKFWKRFCEIFDLNIKDQNRFDASHTELFETISNKMLSYEALEIEKLITEEDICLSLIYTN